MVNLAAPIPKLAEEQPEGSGGDVGRGNVRKSNSVSAYVMSFRFGPTDYVIMRGRGGLGSDHA